MKRPFKARGCAMEWRPPRGPVAMQVCSRCGSAITSDLVPDAYPLPPIYHPTRNACPEPEEDTEPVSAPPVDPGSPRGRSANRRKR